MSIENIPADAYAGLHGRIFDDEIRKRIDAVTDAYCSEAPADEKDARKKNRIIKNLEQYRSIINPTTSYNTKRKDPKTHKARQLRLDQLDNFLAAMEWPVSYFLELVIEENSIFTPEECLHPEKLEGWTKITWPSEDMKFVAGALDICDDETFEMFRNTIITLLPKSYKVLVNELNEDSPEYGWTEKDRPQCMSENPEGFVPEKNIANMSDRVYISMKYLSDDDEHVQKALKDNGIDINTKKIYYPRHYWAIPIEYLNKISKTFGITPHWIFYGEDCHTVLAKKARTEEVMDIFQFLPVYEQQVFKDALSYASKRLAVSR